MHVQIVRHFGVAAVFLALTAFALWNPEPLPPYVPPPPRELVVFQPGPAPAAVVTLSADQRELTVTEHARRDLLVCLRGDCRLVEQWLDPSGFGALGPNDVKAGHGVAPVGSIVQASVAALCEPVPDTSPTSTNNPALAGAPNR